MDWLMPYMLKRKDIYMNNNMKKSSNSKSKALIASALISVMSVFTYSVHSQDVKQTEAKMMKQADENIEKYRKGEVSIQFKTRDGKTLKDAKVEIRQTSSDFMFGCIIFDLIRNENTYKYIRNLGSMYTRIL